MKKLIVFSVVFALMGTFAFADVTISGNFRVNVQLFGQEGDADNGIAKDATMGQEIGAAQVDVSFGDENGGGKVRLFSFPMYGWWHDSSMEANPFAFAWWKPMDVLRIQFGLNPDGDWGAAQISYWGYNAEAQDMVAVDNDDANVKFQRVGFYGGFDDMGLLFSITPMDELAINIALPMVDKGGGWNNQKRSQGSGVLPQNVFLKAHLNVKYILGMGIINFSFVGAGEKDKDTSFGDVWASFYLTSLDNMALDIGLGYHLPNHGVKEGGLQIGVGFKMDMGDLGLKARLGAQLLRQVPEWEEVSKDNWVYQGDDESILIGFGILPSYDLGFMQFFFNAGVDVTLAKFKAAGGGSASDTFIDWYVNPYIKKSAGSINVYAGIKIYSEKAVEDGKVQWAVPIGFNCYF